MTPLTPRARRLRRLMVRQQCQLVTEAHRSGRLADLDDTQVTRCWCCGAWTTSAYRIPECGRCNPTNRFGVAR